MSDSIMIKLVYASMLDYCYYITTTIIRTNVKLWTAALGDRHSSGGGLRPEWEEEYERVESMK